MSTISPNMNLTLPGVGQTDGPQWATDLNSSLNRIDQHTHAPGDGVQITPDGLDINSDLTIKSNNLTNIRSSRFAAQASPLALAADIGCLYVSGVDLYFNDVNGNQIQITQSGGIAGSPGSIANLTPPASAQYVSGTQTFVWQSNTNVAANLDAASIVLRNQTVSSNGLTLSPPNSLAANYSIVLPTLPLSSKILRIDNAGNMSATLDVDNATIGISGNALLVLDDSLTNAKINSAANIARSKLAAPNIDVSPSCSSFSSSSGSFTDVTNLTVTLTTIGRPVMLYLAPDGSTTADASISAVASGSGSCQASFAILNGSTIVGRSLLQSYDPTQTVRSDIPPGAVNAIDYTVFATPGTYTYKVQVAVTGGTARLDNCRLVAYEVG